MLRHLFRAGDSSQKPEAWRQLPLSHCIASATALFYIADVLEMAHAFVGLAPVRFLWAMKQQGLPPGLAQADIPLGDNCMIVPWVDQNVRTRHGVDMPKHVC
jgi:hypothetical protein